MTGCVYLLLCTHTHLLCIADERSWEEKKNTVNACYMFYMFPCSVYISTVQRVCVSVCLSVRSYFPVTASGIFVCVKLSPLYLKSCNTVSITLTLFQFSCHHHIISYPSNKTPNTQATKVIQLQIGMELSES